MIERHPEDRRKLERRIRQHTRDEGWDGVERRDNARRTGAERRPHHWEMSPGGIIKHELLLQHQDKERRLSEERECARLKKEIDRNPEE